MNTLILYVFSLVTDELVDKIHGADNEDCETKAEDEWGSNDYYWAYNNDK